MSSSNPKKVTTPNTNTKPKPKTTPKPKIKPSLPPIECTADEYSDLLETASSLTQSEAQSELIECARYGELDAVRALIEKWSPKLPDFVNSLDDNGTTALHKAGSNGHDSTVQLLLYHKAKYLNNKSKNTPLHWAAGNGHENIVNMILNHDFGFELDVLQKNDFGRSILTEGFASEKTKLVGLLLEHDSASEDKLLDGGEEVDPKEGEIGGGNKDVSSQNKNKSKKVVDGDFKLNADGKVTTTDGQSVNSSNSSSTGGNSGIIHEFDFLRDGNDSNNSIDDMEQIENSDEKPGNNDNITLLGNQGEENKTLLIRELPIKNADSPFGETAIDDTTGLGIWSASLVMARWMASKSILGRFDNKVVLELGAGCGVPGLAVGLHSNATSVYVTDFNPSTVRNLEYNIGINANRPCTKSTAGTNGEWIERVKASSIDWDDESTWPDDKMDFIIGSDLIYQKSIVPLLKKVVAGLLKPDGRFLYTCPSDGRDGLVEFIQTMRKEGFRCTSEEVAPDLYRSNPLSSGDEEDAFLHFYELPVTEYKLYEFRLCKN
jgi:ankyrin repeat protein/predicted nicotinamide N-methyase